MSSTSASDYRLLCAAFVEEVLLRPRMCFRDLSELSAILHGHAVAFSQLGLVGTRGHTFNAAFSDWLVVGTGVSASTGWAPAVEELASAAGVDAEALFADLVRAFLKEWPPATS